MKTGFKTKIGFKIKTGIKTRPRLLVKKGDGVL